MSKEKKVLIFLIFLLFVLVIISLSIGRYPIYPREIFEILKALFIGNTDNIANEKLLILTKIRIPRIIGAIFIGATLAISGTNYQALFQNPIVSPDILGASQGSAFGAALGLYLGMNSKAVSFIAFIMGIIAVSIVYITSTKFNSNRILGLILIGMAIGTMFSSSVSFIKLIADTENTLPAITYWLMGSLAALKLEDLTILLLPLIISLSISMIMKWKMNLLTMGEEEAQALGINIKITRLIIISATTLMTAVCVSFTGMIGWVGLIIPHFSRTLIGTDYRNLIPISGLIGGIFLLIIDNIARTITTSEIPIGILTSFIGAPVFLYLVFKKGYE